MGTLTRTVYCLTGGRTTKSSFPNLSMSELPWDRFFLHFFAMRILSRGQVMTACHSKRCHSTPLQNSSVAGVMGQALFLFFFPLSSGPVLSIYSRHRLQSCYFFGPKTRWPACVSFGSSREERGEGMGQIARRCYLVSRYTTLRQNRERKNMVCRVSNSTRTRCGGTTKLGELFPMPR